MADYPAVPQLVGSVVESSDGTIVDRAESGKPRFRTFYSQVWSQIRVQHDLNDADKALIEDHYRIHKRVTFTFTFIGSGTAYTCRYAEHPQFAPIEGGDRWRVQSVLVVVDRLPYGVVGITSASSIVCTGVKA